jgi:UbiA prenyltransferase family
MPSRWWVYQRERFPIFAHGVLIAAFSLSAVSISALLRHQVGFARAGTPLVAFATAFLFFLQLRIADEFKDFEEDSRYRPYRAVPRGLVSLRELGVVFGLAACVQLALALWLDPRLIPLLGITWIYLALMSKEFFVGQWLRAHPITYMLSHMVILPLVDLYATACDWLVAGSGPPRGLIWFLMVSYCNGLVIELGRKIRAPEDEEPGVNTYSALWGPARAASAWLSALFLTAACAAVTASQVGFLAPAVCLLLTLCVLAAIVAGRFVQMPRPSRAKLIEPYSGVWTLLVYLSLGAVPLLLRWLAATRGW